jgi:RimJ/RimL family protein N-acetyltransferase
VPGVELVPYTDPDPWLTEALETDPRAMAELGGPWPVEQTHATHARRVAAVLAGSSWWFAIVPDPATGPIGTIGVWASNWQGEDLSEAGWMILPEYHGRGYGGAALGALLERARADDRWGDIHAFPGATNAASNALCRKFGFEQLEGGDADYNGRHFPVHHWVWRAGTPAPPGAGAASGSASAR